MDFEQIVRMALYMAPLILFFAWYFGKSSKDIYYEEIAKFHESKKGVEE